MTARDPHERISRFLSLILRHAPDKIGLALDRNGWPARCRRGSSISPGSDPLGRRRR
jgi:RNA:NAD 2'-phosphotransferase (TPT1/KptA family)